MDILQVNKYYFHKGGAERYFFSLSEELEKRGHRVIPFAMKHPNNLPTPYADYFVDEKDFHASYSIAERASASFSFIRSRQAAANIRRLIERYKPQVAHLHNIYHQITPSIIPVLIEAGVAVVMTLHDYKLVCPNYSMFAHGAYCFKCKNGNFLQAPLTRCHYDSFWRSLLLSIEASWQKATGVYRRMDCLIAPSRFMRDRLIEGGFDGDRIVYVPSFMPWTGDRRSEEADSAADADAANARKKKIRIPRESTPPAGTANAGGPQRSLPDKYLLYFGRMSAEKGVHTLLEAVRETGDMPLVLCGEGPQLAELERFAAEHRMKHVTFTGHLPKDELETVIKRAYTVVIPSLFPENAPFAMLESASLGTPVIASDVGGLPEMVEHLGGILFSHGSSRELAGKIRTLWENEDEAERLGSAGIAAARKIYGADRHLQRIEQIYERVVNGVCGAPRAHAEP